MDLAKLPAGATELSEEEAGQFLGAGLKEIYIATLTGTAATGLAPDLETMVAAAVEQVTTQASAALSDTYSHGAMPRLDDSAEMAQAFVRRVLTRFREAICAELFEHPDLSTYARGLVVGLGPTIITLLKLPAAYVALSVPLSIMVGRVGMRSMCHDIETRRQEKAYRHQRLELHRQNLLNIETEMMAVKDQETYSLMQAWRDNEVKLIRELEEELRQL